MPALVDTTIRLLSQEPLAGRMPTADLLRLAELLDGVGFAYLEVSGGGVFDTAVRRGVESPWERIRALKARTKTPLGMALRGRFLVGSRPVGGDFARRFVASAAESGIDVFRLEDPLNDVSNLREAGEAIVAAEREFDAGLIYSPGKGAETQQLVEQARRLPELGAARVLLHDPSSALEPYRANELMAALAEGSGLPVGLYCQGAGGSGLAAALEAARAGADLIACAVYPIALVLHRVSGEALASALSGAGMEVAVDLDRLWHGAELVDEFIGDDPMTPLAPRIAVRAAQHELPAGLVASIDTRLRAHGASDRLDEVLDELVVIRGEAGSPPLAAPIGQILASQAIVHVLSATRYTTVVDELRDLLQGRFGTPPGQIDATVQRAVALVAGDAQPTDEPVVLDDLRAEAKGLAASEEELLLLALFGEEAEPLLRAIRDRSSGEDSLLGGGVDQTRAERIREVVRIVQETGIAEIAVEEEGTRVSVKRTEEPAPVEVPVSAGAPVTGGAPLEPEPELDAEPTDGAIRIDAPMVGVFYRAPQPGAPPFVEVGDAVAAGQTLCILEAMKLMNEVKAEMEGVVRTIHVQNGQPVEFGQALFDLEPMLARPLDAL
ncbi:MAG TPA: acetyl-CoA carboxylase biotin carboxyl carrier protein [Gaiellaceae bacterium]|nr:acetyl-CoA carboxylase biotin carboxyl carrier protein [Gaiellaceae bacterium]